MTRQPPNVECEQCHTPFRVRPYRLRNETVRFCSRPCRDASLRKRATFQCLECGKQKGPTDFYRDNLKFRGHVARCKACYSAKVKTDRPHNPKHRFNESKRNARQRGFEWHLTYEQFLDWIWGAPCYYCGDTSKPGGIDRLNNEPFYDMTNALPCCGICNGMKSKLSLHDFLTRVQKIVDRLGRSAQEDVA